MKNRLGVTKTRELAVGCSARVFLGKDRQGNLLALKCFKNSQSSHRAFLREQNALRKIRHPNVIDVVESVETKSLGSKNILVMPYAVNGDCLDLVMRVGKLPEDVVRTLLLPILDGVGACHAAGVLHRDLKPENFLLFEDFNVKICDFGFSATRDMADKDGKQKDAKLRTICGTAGFMAPEVSRGAEHDEACDIWSLGVSIFIMVAGFPPYAGNQRRGPRYQSIIREQWTRFWAIQRRFASFSVEFMELLQRMLTVDPSKRATLTEIRRSKWMCGETLGPREIVEEINELLVKSGQEQAP